MLPSGGDGWGFLVFLQSKSLSHLNVLSLLLQSEDIDLRETAYSLQIVTVDTIAYQNQFEHAKMTAISLELQY